MKSNKVRTLIAISEKRKTLRLATIKRLNAGNIPPDFGAYSKGIDPAPEWVRSFKDQFLFDKQIND